MVRLRLDVLAAAALLSLAAAAPAAAGGCCPEPYSNCPCSPLAVAEPFDTLDSGIYVVNQGPVFSGPGPYLPRRGPDLRPGPYPYVGFVYSGYPYGLQNAGGYPRGSYSPYTGYPYAEPYDGPYVKRVSYRPARVYRRHVGPRVLHSK